MAMRHSAGAAVFDKAGGFAPTLGIIGTVMGLVHVLENLSRPATLGPSISGAFIATLYGVGSANLVFLPVANKLKYLSNIEAELRMMTLEGILAIQAGDNPRIVESKLLSYLDPAERAERRRGRDRDRAATGGAEAAPAAASGHASAPRRPTPAAPVDRPRERGALAAHLLGHDHAADGAVHGAVLDLVGEHLQVQVAPGVAEGRLLGQDPAGREADPAERQLGQRASPPQRHSVDPSPAPAPSSRRPRPPRPPRSSRSSRRSSRRSTPTPRSTRSRCSSRP